MGSWVNYSCWAFLLIYSVGWWIPDCASISFHSASISFSVYNNFIPNYVLRRIMIPYPSHDSLKFVSIVLAVRDIPGSGIPRLSE